MPAWEASAPGAATAGRYLGVKSVTVFPDNATRGKPAVFGTYLLFSAETGETLAVMDADPPHGLAHGCGLRAGQPLPLAAGCRAPADGGRRRAGARSSSAPRLGAADPRGGDLEPLGAAAPSRWSRSWPTPASPSPSPTTSRPPSAGPTSSPPPPYPSEPLIRGAWLTPGTHLDCVGAFRPSMRETDDEVVRRARIFVDTRTGAFGEAGDILQPLSRRRDRQGGRAGRSLRSDARHSDRPPDARGDHPLQVGRRRHRGPRRRRRRLRDVRW